MAVPLPVGTFAFFGGIIGTLGGHWQLLAVKSKNWQKKTLAGDWHLPSGLARLSSASLFISHHQLGQPHLYLRRQISARLSSLLVFPITRRRTKKPQKTVAEKAVADWHLLLLWPQHRRNGEEWATVDKRPVAAAVTIGFFWSADLWRQNKWKKLKGTDLAKKRRKTAAAAKAKGKQTLAQQIRCRRAAIEIGGMGWHIVVQYGALVFWLDIGSRMGKERGRKAQSGLERELLGELRCGGRKCGRRRDWRHW
jgi:hypothetical protein